MWKRYRGEIRTTEEGRASEKRTNERVDCHPGHLNEMSIENGGKADRITNR